MSDGSCAAVTIDHHVAEVALAATGKGQRMARAYWDELPRIFEQLDADDAVRAVLLHTAGEHFSCGLDLAAMAPQMMELMVPDARAAVRTRLLGVIERLQRTRSSRARPAGGHCRVHGEARAEGPRRLTPAGDRCLIGTRAPPRR